MIRIGAIVCLLVFSITMVSFAAEKATPVTKLGNGIGNMLSGWMEIPRHVKERSQEKNWFYGITYGTVEGTGYGVVRTAAGGLDTVTFVFPPYDKPIMEPIYHF
jgi:putative exosortase-associated protein (TIGR04073 family)